MYRQGKMCENVERGERKERDGRVVVAVASPDAHRRAVHLILPLTDRVTRTGKAISHSMFPHCHMNVSIFSLYSRTRCNKRENLIEELDESIIR